MATFFSYNALVSQRASGYRNTTYALAELADNSFDADAECVRIIFLESRQEGRRHILEILICDDGKGMSKSVLQEALQFGNTTNTDLDQVVAKRKKGKFGYGLPNASLSQCPAVHVFTWQEKKKDQVYSTYMDLEELSKTPSIDIPDVKVADLPLHYSQVGAVMRPEAGTIVSWRRCDRLSNTKADSIIEKSELVLGRLFRYLVTEGKKITFSRYEYNSGKAQYTQAAPDKTVRPNDPLFLMTNTAISVVLWHEANKDSGCPKARV